VAQFTAIPKRTDKGIPSGAGDLRPRTLAAARMAGVSIGATLQAMTRRERALCEVTP